MIIGEYEPRRVERRGGDRRRSIYFERIRGNDKASDAVMHCGRPCVSKAGKTRLVDASNAP